MRTRQVIVNVSFSFDIITMQVHNKLLTLLSLILEFGALIWLVFVTYFLISHFNTSISLKKLEQMFFSETETTLGNYPGLQQGKMV